MNKFILILSAIHEERLSTVYQEAADILQRSSPRWLRILPHILLFYHEGDTGSAASLFPVASLLHEQVVVMRIHDDWHGRNLADMADRLESFFHPSSNEIGGVNLQKRAAVCS